MSTLLSTNFKLPNQLSKYKGKVREVISLKNDLLVILTTDRLSAFDVVLPKGIPYKGQILNQISLHMLDSTKKLVPNWLIYSPDPIVSIGKRCEPYKVEMIIRGYLSGHAAREYKKGKRYISGVKMPDNMNENDPFETPIITPSTKSVNGHDEDISKEEILDKGLVSESDYNKIENYTNVLFEKGSKIARERGLILVDTKYEFGKSKDGEVLLIDEIHTPDSSRYFYLEGYEERQKNFYNQKQLSKEFARQWLISEGFQGLKGQQLPEIDDNFTKMVSERYVELYETITGKEFIPAQTENIENRVKHNILSFLENY
jgi:phosphoribosylaminoimidazole-succinocarboxamide synthase